MDPNIVQSKLHYIIIDDELIFTELFNEPLDEYYDILSRCKILRFESADNHNSPFDYPIVLTPCLTHIYLNKYFNQPIVLTHGLIHISFGSRFDHPIILSPNLECVDLGTMFNQTLVLNKSLKDLTTGYYFNHPLNISKNLIRICINELYKHSIVLTKKLKDCSFICNPCHQINLTKNVERVYFGTNFQRKFSLNKNLVSVRFRCGTARPIVLGKNIKYLSLGCVCNNIYLPKYLKTFDGRFYQQERFIFERPLDTISFNPSNEYLCDNIPDKTSNVMLNCEYGIMPRRKLINPPSNTLVTVIPYSNVVR